MPSPSPTTQAPRRIAFLRSHAFFGGLGILLVAGGLWVERTGLGPWIYRRGAVLDGEWWRLLTSHFVHASPRHLGWNLAALALLAVLLAPLARLGSWLLVLGCSLAAVAFGLLFLSPEAEAVAGFSGILHGLWAGAAGREMRYRRATGWVLLLPLLLKVGWEGFTGSVMAAAVLGSAIAVGTHLYGALGGLLAGLLGPRETRADLDSCDRIETPAAIESSSETPGPGRSD